MAPFVPAGPPPKPLNLSSKPLKSFNWTKIAANQAKATVWNNLDDKEVHDKLQGKTYEEFEELFAAKETKAKDEKPGASVDDLAAKKVTFLDPKRSQNTDMMQKALKISSQTIKEALSKADTTILTHEVLTELLKFVPQEEELGLIAQHKAENQNFATAEKFIYDVSEIDMYEGKLKALFFKTGYTEFEDDAEALLAWLKGATDDVVESKKFKEILKIILALGNYMNAGQRGGAYGFKLGSLLKMMDTKSTITNRKHTLLHYFTELLEKKFPELCDFQTQLTHVEDGAKVTMAQIRTAIVTIRDNLKQLETLLTALKNSKKSDPKDQFQPIMSAFNETASNKYKSLDERFKKYEKDYAKAVELYGEDPKMEPEEFFGIFWKFCQAFAQAKVDNEEAAKKALADAKKEAERKDREDKRRRKRESTGNKAGDVKGGGGGDHEGGLDDIISSIRTGKAFGSSGDAPVRQRRPGGLTINKGDHAPDSANSSVHNLPLGEKDKDKKSSHALTSSSTLSKGKHGGLGNSTVVSAGGLGGGSGNSDDTGSTKEREKVTSLSGSVGRKLSIAVTGMLSKEGNGNSRLDRKPSSETLKSNRNSMEVKRK